MSGDALMAQPFDLRNLKLQGEPRRVVEQVARMQLRDLNRDRHLLRLAKRRAGVASPRLFF